MTFFVKTTCILLIEQIQPQGTWLNTSYGSQGLNHMFVANIGPKVLARQGTQ